MFSKRKLLIVLSVLFLVGSFTFTSFSLAQESDPAVERRRAELQRELERIEDEIAEQRVFLDEKQKERTSLERDIAIIDSKIQQSRLQIQATNLKIRKLSQEIGGKEETIDSLSAKMQREKESLAQIIRKTNEIDSLSLVEMVLGNRKLSEFFEDIDSFNSIKASLRDSFRQIENTKENTEVEKQTLVSDRTELQDLRNLQVVQQNRLEAQEAEKQQLLNITKGEEQVYQDIISNKQKTAAEIRSELFSLRDTAAIPFGEALALAKEAEERTGVRAAFILGILAEESNLGENVGTGTWKEDMHPERDQPVFKVIAETLGLNPDTLPVSAKPWYGWGGAMGPAQFIPSTWACFTGYVNSITGSCRWGPGYTGSWSYNADKDRIRKLIGEGRPADPWEPKDAIMASADLLADNGAAGGGYSNERLAALRYFAGWVNATKPQYAFYGDDVMELAAHYQKQINILENN